MNLTCSRIILFVQDIRKMGAFYRDALGLEPKITPDLPDDWLEFWAGPISIALHQHGEPNRAKRPPKIVFFAEDVSALRELLIAKGVKLSKVLSADGFLFCNGQDPEGNHFSISSRV